MCVIYAVYKNLPSDDELSRGAWQNDDGAGVCWLDKTKKTVRWIKGLKSDVDIVKKVIEDNKIVAPFGIHFRTASVGGTDMDLTHPFPIWKGVPTWHAGNAPLVLMHNGHIGDWKSWAVPLMLSSKEQTPLPPWSDSRGLAYAVQQKGEGLLEFILGTSRAMILDSEPSEGMDADDNESYFRLYGRWHHNDKEGFYQSVETACVVRGKGRGSTVWAGDTGSTQMTTTPTPTSPSADAADDKKVIIITDKDNSSVWTVDELEVLANRIEEEQNNAATVIGL